jgi:hypothetical protein
LTRAVANLRSGNPMWNKRKIAVQLRREGFKVPVSTVGRILAHLVKRGAIVPAAKWTTAKAAALSAKSLPNSLSPKHPSS